MSHFTRVRTTLRDPHVLASALAELGFPHVEVHDTPQALYGYLGDQRPQRAEVVVRRRHIGRSSNDIGFARQPDGTFDAVISEFDRRTYGAAWLARVTQAYGHTAALSYAASHGYDIVADDIDQDGTRRLTLRRPA
jgi:hypothetical protein